MFIEPLFKITCSVFLFAWVLVLFQDIGRTIFSHTHWNVLAFFDIFRIVQLSWLQSLEPCQTFWNGLAKKVRRALSLVGLGWEVKQFFSKGLSVDWFESTVLYYLLVAQGVWIFVILDIISQIDLLFDGWLIVCLNGILYLSHLEHTLFRRRWDINISINK